MNAGYVHVLLRVLVVLYSAMEASLHPIPRWRGYILRPMPRYSPGRWAPGRTSTSQGRFAQAPPTGRATVLRHTIVLRGDGSSMNMPGRRVQITVSTGGQNPGFPVNNNQPIVSSRGRKTNIIDTNRRTGPGNTVIGARINNNNNNNMKNIENNNSVSGLNVLFPSAMASGRNIPSNANLGLKVNGRNERSRLQPTSATGRAGSAPVNNVPNTNYNTYMELLRVLQTGISNELSNSARAGDFMPNTPYVRRQSGALDTTSGGEQQRPTAEEIAEALEP